MWENTGNTPRKTTGIEFRYCFAVSMHMVFVREGVLHTLDLADSCRDRAVSFNPPTHFVLSSNHAPVGLLHYRLQADHPRSSAPNTTAPTPKPLTLCVGGSLICTFLENIKEQMRQTRGRGTVLWRTGSPSFRGGGRPDSRRGRAYGATEAANLWYFRCLNYSF